MNRFSEQLALEYDEALGGYPVSLPRDFRQALAEVEGRLDREELRQWAEEGAAIARHSLRSWEAAAEFYRASPSLLENMPFAAVRQWAEAGRDLAEESATLAAAFFKAAAAGVSFLNPQQMRDWAALGKQLYKGTWKSSSLASQFFEVSPELLPHISMPEMRALTRFVDTLAARSYELASACLASAPKLLAGMDRHDRAPFLGFATVIAETSWADARVYFEKGPSLLHHLHPDQRSRFLLLASAVARKAGRQAYPFFAESASSLGLLDQELHNRLLTMAEVLAPKSGAAAMEFLKSVPEVLRRIRMDDLEAWHAEGRRLLEQTEEGGLAFFRLESGKGEEVIELLSSRVELSRVGEVLRMYCKALTGTNVSIQSAGALAEKGVGWVNTERASTEGTSVFLPPVVEEAGDKGENFAVYKVYATHQAGHLEFGSFRFRFDRPGGLIETVRHEREPENPEHRALTDMERFFDLFDDRQLASDLFTVVEDARIDFLIKSEYGGIRSPLRRVQGRELERRDDVERMPLRQAAVENLIRLSLDGAHTVRWPAQRMQTMGQAAALLRLVQNAEASVEDAAEVTLRLYDLLSQVPNVMLEGDDAGEWAELSEDDISLDMLPAGGKGGPPQAGGESQTGEPGEGDMPYESPDAPDFRGDFKPELVQLLMRLRGDAKDQGEVDGQFAPLTPEQLKELMEKSVEIDVTAFAEGDLDMSSGMFLSNLMKEAGTPASQKDKGPKDGKPGDGAGEEEEPQEVEDAPAIEYFWYDEWDFRANDYKPHWCRVVQQKLEEGEDRFFEKTLQEHAGLVAQTRKQFELMRPELFRKIKKLFDGEEIDLDAAIDFVTERRAGHPGDDKIYFRRNKIERDVAVAFLLDMSASTDEEINRRDRKGEDDDFDDDPRRYLAWWAQKRSKELQNPIKRIIDLEKESTVLLMEALETIGDRYGIYGFSGYGRDNVEFYVIKDLDESFSDKIKKRIDKVVPIRSTRMGPAIRHATMKLDHSDAKVKILFLVSDGRPQDHGYGRDRTEKEYAIHDTKMALNEAKRKGIVPFALTVDRAGHDYLKTMCEDIGYEVVGDIEALPSRLPTLYRKLTE
jgi:nitric oxide reductase NorD protein